MAAIPGLQTNNGRQIPMITPMAKPFSRLLYTLIGMSALGCTALLTACGQGEPTSPAPETSKAKIQSQLSDQNTQEQASRDRQSEARRAIVLLEAAQQRGWSQGHNATVACLQGERAQTDGNELRCEEQAYVEKNYRQINNR